MPIDSLPFYDNASIDVFPILRVHLLFPGRPSGLPLRLDAFLQDYRICGFQGAFPSGALRRTELFYSGGRLLSRAVPGEVPSAAWVLTVVFGMGTGVAPTRIAARSLSY